MTQELVVSKIPKIHILDNLSAFFWIITFCCMVNIDHMMGLTKKQKKNILTAKIKKSIKSLKIIEHWFFIWIQYKFVCVSYFVLDLCKYSKENSVFLSKIGIKQEDSIFCNINLHEK